QLPRAPGSREHRWAHLLSGPVEAPAAPVPAARDAEAAPPGLTVAELAALKAQVARLAEETAELRALVERLYRNLGVSK
ncbi:MAG: DUF480 domain-containing protein, partial [Thermoanaerobaculia bacterium]